MDGDLKHAFMCLALRTMCQEDVITNDVYVTTRMHVNELVASVSRSNWISSMSAALNRAGIVTLENAGDEDALCKQLYIWHVFDLKRKGL